MAELIPSIEDQMEDTETCDLCGEEFELGEDMARMDGQTELPLIVHVRCAQIHFTKRSWH